MRRIGQGLDATTCTRLPISKFTQFVDHRLLPTLLCRDALRTQLLCGQWALRTQLLLTRRNQMRHKSICTRVIGLHFSRKQHRETRGLRIVFGEPHEQRSPEKTVQRKARDFESITVDRI